MGSYAAWRSALFLFMYPENLLHPTLRRSEEQSQAFKELVEKVRDSSRLKPQGACEAADDYQRYLADINSLMRVQASCTAQVALAPGEGCAGARNLTRRELLFAFAVGWNGAAYWCTRRIDQGADTPWNPIGGWAERVEEIFGAVPVETPDGKRLIVLIARIRVRNKDGTSGPARLQLHRFDLDAFHKENRAWDTEAKDLEDLPAGADKDAARCLVFMEQRVQEDVFPQVYVWLRAPVPPPTGFFLYRRPLAPDLSGWQPGVWDHDFFVRGTSDLKRPSGLALFWSKLGIPLHSQCRNHHHLGVRI